MDSSIALWAAVGLSVAGSLVAGIRRFTDLDSRITQHEDDMKELKEIIERHEELYYTLREELTAVKVALIGIDGTNGFRGEFLDFRDRVLNRLEDK